MNKLFLIPMVLISTLFGQLKITSSEKLLIPQTEYWSNPIFAPNGKEIYYTNIDYNGIWQYSIASKLVKVITTDKTSGYNFAVSEDGQKIAYRRIVSEIDQGNRIQEAVEMDIPTLSKTVIHQGTSVSFPTFKDNKATTADKFSIRKIVTPSSKAPITILGIEDTKIVLLQNGAKIIFDPLKNGRYIWPKLSPDGTNIVAVDMERGAFISDLNGDNIVMLGKCNSPQWTRSGNWIIGMDDSDDGRVITGSDIIAVSKDGKTKIQLTNTASQMEMFPAVSTVENKIIVSTASGELLLLTYEEGQ